MKDEQSAAHGQEVEQPEHVNGQGSTNGNGTNGNGKYASHVEPRLETIRAWRRKGLTEEEICKNLGVGRTTLHTYKQQHPELIEILKTSKSDADAQVESSLFKKANGYEYEEITVIEENGVVTKTQRTRKHVPPDNTCMIFYLKNRFSSDWNDRTTHELTGPNGGPLTQLVHIFIPENGRDTPSTETLETGSTKAESPQTESEIGRK